MTWIVGKNTFFGHAILASDICVTFTSGTGEKSHVDCLQKVYPLGRFVVGGFSGSVRIGFSLLGDFQRELSTSPPDEAWNINIIANTWLPRVAKKIFKLSPQIEQHVGSSIIIAAAHPTKNRGDAPWPWTDIYKFSSPEFEPEHARQDEAIAIGSGSALTEHMDKVIEACNSSTFHQMILGGEIAQARFVAEILEKTMQEVPSKGISDKFQVVLVNRGKVIIFNHEYDKVTDKGLEPVVRFPKIAKNYEQFIDLTIKLNGRADSAWC